MKRSIIFCLLSLSAHIHSNDRLRTNHTAEHPDTVSVQGKKTTTYYCNVMTAATLAIVAAGTLYVASRSGIVLSGELEGAISAASAIPGLAAAWFCLRDKSSEQLCKTQKTYQTRA